MFVFSLSNEENRPALKHDPLLLNPQGTNCDKTIRLINSRHFSFVNNLSNFKIQDIYLSFMRHLARVTQLELAIKIKLMVCDLA